MTSRFVMYIDDLMVVNSSQRGDTWPMASPGTKSARWWSSLSPDFAVFSSMGRMSTVTGRWSMTERSMP